MIPVHWLDMPDGNPGRCCWDQTIVGWLTDRRVAGRPSYVHTSGPQPAPDGPGGGAVVVVAARYWAGQESALSDRLAHLAWVVLILTSDEESLLDWTVLRHPNMHLWVQSPRPDRHDDPALRFIPHGTSEGFATRLGGLPQKGTPWAFAGQLTHRVRDEMAAHMPRIAGGVLIGRDGFAQGDGDEYAAMLADAKVAPSPSGPATPDSFRTWEALEAGCVPITDDGPMPDAPKGGRAIAGYPSGFWEHLIRGPVPWPVVTHWRHGPREAKAVLEAWPHANNRAQGWWQAWQHALAGRLADDVAELSGQRPSAATDRITVLIPTSPIPSHPSTEVLEQTMASIWSQLPGADVVLMIDGLRREQAHYSTAYGEYVRRVLWLNRSWGCRPLVAEHHMHQSGLTRWALAGVRTPLVLFVEHDTPLDGPIAWDDCAELVENGPVAVLRFHHEDRVLDVHRPMMLGEGPTVMAGVRVWPTSQWSQRPHLARTSYYRRIIEDHFAPGDRWMIEDRMHSAASSAWIDHGWDGWARHPIAIHHEPGPVGIRRSLHLDGRASDPKWVDR